MSAPHIASREAARYVPVNLDTPERQRQRHLARKARVGAITRNEHIQQAYNARREVNGVPRQGTRGDLI